MALRKKTYKRKTMRKRNLGKKTKKCCKYRRRCYRKKTNKKNCRKRCKKTCFRKMKGGNQIAYYKFNNQNPAPRDFLTSSIIHGCAGGSRKKIRRGGGGRSTLFPQHFLNLGRGIGHNINEIKSGFLGVDSNASPYPTKDQPIDRKLTGEFTYSPSNIRKIRMNAEKEVG